MSATTANLDWYAVEPSVFEGGQSAGDWQVGDDITVRFAPASEPDDGTHALITETWYIEDYRAMHNEGDESEPAYGVMCRVEYLVCRDVDDPGGTEVWSDYEYDDGADVRVYDTADDALEAARNRAGRSALSGGFYYAWDGRRQIR